MKNIIIAISIFLLSISIGKSQEIKIKSNNYKHQAGFTIGSFYGIAPTYRYNMGKNAIQVAALPIFNDGEFNYTFSIGYLRRLVRSDLLDLSFVSSIGTNNVFYDNRLNLALGSQVDLKLTKYITLESKFGFDLGRRQEFIGTEVNNIYGLTPAIGVGIMYNFIEGE